MKGKVVFILFVSIFLLVMSVFTVYGVQGVVELTPVEDLSNLKAGDSFDVNVNIKGVSNLVGGELIISYDPALVELVSKELSLYDVTNFSALDGVTNANLQDSVGEAVLIFGLNKDSIPISGDSHVGTLNFKALTKGTGAISIADRSQLVSEDAIGNYSAIEFTSASLNYSVLGVGIISCTVTDSNNGPISGVTVNLLRDSDVAYSAVTSADGSFRIDNVLEGSYVISINDSRYDSHSANVIISDGAMTNMDISLSLNVPGDVNDDDLVTLQDLVFVANHYGNNASNDEGSAKSDLNRDGKVDVIDLIFVNRRMTN